jgi:hypothetical protein
LAILLNSLFYLLTIGSSPKGIGYILILAILLNSLFDLLSSNPGPGPVPKTRAQIRIFFITSLLRH